MAYQTPSTHPNALVSTLLPTDRPAEATAEHLEREHWTDSADLSAKKLPNTVVVHVTSSDGSLSTFLHKTGSFGPSSSVLLDQDGRAFLLAQTITATAANVAVSNALAVGIAPQDVVLSPRWIDVDPLAVAITLNDVTLSLDSLVSVDALQVAIAFNDAALSPSYLEVGKLQVAATLNNVTPFGGWLQVDALSTALTFNDATLYASGPLSVDALSVSFTFNDMTPFLGGLNVSALQASITLNDVSPQFVGTAILTSGDAQSGSDAVNLSGDEAPGILLTSGS